MRKLLFRIGTASLSILGTGLMLVVGCGQASSPPQPKPDRNVEVNKMQYTIPDFVQKMIDAPVPEDGKVHVQKRGRLRIDADTFDCIMPAQIHPSLKNLAPAYHGVGPGKHIRLDGAWSNGSVCHDDGRNQVSHLILEPNQSGKPYKLTLAVWQGDALWVGAIARPYLAQCPEGVPISSDGMCGRTPYWNVEGDKLALSKMFMQEIQAGE